MKNVGILLLPGVLIAGAIFWTEVWKNNIDSGRVVEYTEEDRRYDELGLKAAQLALDLHNQTRSERIEILRLYEMSIGADEMESIEYAEEEFLMERKDLEKEVNYYRSVLSEHP